MGSLAAAAIALVAPYLAVGAEGFAKKGGEAAVEGVKALASRLKDWWSDDPVAKPAAENLSSNPQAYQEILTGLLATKLEDDPAFRTEIEALVGALEPHVDVVQRIGKAQGVVGADIRKLISGSVRVDQTVEEAETVVGARIDEMGT